ncbi:MAG: FAD-dependent thymidylate synthase [Synergistaceae bacterium]|nr:FAD-dependent thymidylate synthase [Synergistaceae bacterium]
MQVKLLTTSEHLASMEHNAAYAMLTCHANAGKLQNEKPRIFIEKAIKAGHESILEHITLTYEVNNLSRACLQELARHRHISLSVESTRHTLKESLNKEDNPLYVPDGYEITWNNEKYNPALIMGVCLITLSGNKNISNDELKYFIPEFFLTNLILTANIRELRHIVKLRTSKAALLEFQALARNLVDILPEQFKYLLEDCVNE